VWAGSRFKRGLAALAIAGSLWVLGRSVGFLSPWFGVTAAFCLLGLMDLARPYFRLPLPRLLGKIRPEQGRGSGYRSFWRLLGVYAFGAFLRRTPLRLLNRRVYLSSSPRDVASILAHLEQAEAAHFWDSVATLPYLVLAGVQSRWSTVACVPLFDLVVNVYPMLHLRTVRARIARVSRRCEIRRTSA